MSKSSSKGAPEPSPITVSVATEEHIRKCHEWVLKHLDHCPALFKKYVKAGVAAIVDSEIRQADKKSGGWGFIVKAVLENPDVKPTAILEAAGGNRQAGLLVLRELEMFGVYTGFQHKTHKTPVHDSRPKGSRTPEQ